MNSTNTHISDGELIVLTLLWIVVAMIWIAVLKLGNNSSTFDKGTNDSDR
jgi:hypothetical protein